MAEPRGPRADADLASEMPPADEIVPVTILASGPVGEARTDAPGGRGFLRMHLRRRGEVLEVLGARFVEHGEVAELPLRDGPAFEVTVRGRRVTAGNLPDVGVRRSYPDPSGAPERQGHHVTIDDEGEFTVRVAAGLLRGPELPFAAVSLGEVSTTADHDGSATTRARGGELLRTASTPVGALSRLPEGLDREVRRAVSPGGVGEEIEEPGAPGRDGDDDSGR